MSCLCEKSRWLHNHTFSAVAKLPSVSVSTSELRCFTSLCFCLILFLLLLQKGLSIRILTISPFKYFSFFVWHFPGGSVIKKKNLPANSGDAREMVNPCARKIPWRRAWQPSLVFSPGESQVQRILAGYSPWGRKELDMTEHSCMHSLSNQLYTKLLNSSSFILLLCFKK